MDIKQIDSQKHPIIQTLRDLQTEKGRKQSGAFIVEGLMITSRALDYGSARFIICTDRFVSSPESSVITSAASKAGVEVFQVSEGLMGKIVPAKPTVQVAAVVERRLYDPHAFLNEEKPLLILIDQCENPDNLGMLLRSLDAAGVDGVILTSDSVDPFHRLCVRASRGSVLSLRLSVIENPEDWVDEAKRNDFRAAVSSAHGSEIYWEADLTGPLMIVVGNEHTGVRESIREIADSLIRIPMSGRMESLNIAVAGALLAYEAVRQRKWKEKDQSKIL